MNANENLEPKANPDKIEILINEYNETVKDKDVTSLEEFIRIKAKANPEVVGWLFDFENREDFNNGLTIYRPGIVSHFHNVFLDRDPMNFRRRRF